MQLSGRMAVIIRGCANSAVAQTSRSSPSVPMAAVSSLPEFLKLNFSGKRPLYAVHPQSPRLQDGYSGARKISIARVLSSSQAQLNNPMLQSPHEAEYWLRQGRGLLPGPTSTRFSS